VLAAAGGAAALALSGGEDKPKTATTVTTSVTRATGSDQRVPSSGAYSGTARQRGARASLNKDTPMSMTFSSSGSSVAYPGVGCAGKLLPTGFDGQRRVYQEQITSGPCDNGGVWRVLVVSSDRLEAGWTLPSQDYTVSAVLRRES
jgi:hypothetical protein